MLKDVHPLWEHSAYRPAGRSSKDALNSQNPKIARTGRILDYEFPDDILAERDNLDPSKKQKFRKMNPFIIKLRPGDTPEFPKGKELWVYYLGAKEPRPEGWYIAWPRSDSHIARPIEYRTTQPCAWVIQNVDGSQIWLKRVLQYVEPYRLVATSDIESTPLPRSSEPEVSDATAESSVEAQSDGEGDMFSERPHKAQYNVVQEEALSPRHRTKGGNPYLHSGNDMAGDFDSNEPGRGLASSQMNGAMPSPELRGSSMRNVSPFDDFKECVEDFVSQNMGSVKGRYSTSDEDLPLLSSLLRNQAEQPPTKEPSECPLPVSLRYALKIVADCPPAGNNRW